MATSATTTAAVFSSFRYVHFPIPFRVMSYVIKLPLQNYATSNNVTIDYFSVTVIFLEEVVDWDRVEQIIP